MAALPYMQLYVADYLADTAHLSAEENGAYLLLIFNYWQRGHALSNASERLANVARLSSERWAEIKPKLAEFFTIDGDTWTHDRIEADLAAVAAKSTKAKAAGATGGSKRVANAKQTLGERSTDADQTSSHTDTDTDTEDKSKSAGADLLGASKGNPEGRKSSATEIDTWLRSLDGDAIPADDPIFSYAENAGIPLDFLELSWHRFVEDMRERGKRQKDWRAHYRNAVKGNWLKLWWLQDGEYRLTTAGEQARRARA
ncbi:YdaU family protein [Frateuria sp. GZRR33]|uniref:YdaU family protein n=1 Tax=Frateuria sp. GZRR33 TaxID=3351535 RepID=UPI003EDC27AA